MKILLERVDTAPAPHIARDFLNQQFVPECAPRLQLGFARRLSACDAIVNLHSEVGPEFLIKVVCTSPRPPKPPR